MAKRADRKLRRYGMSLDDALHWKIAGGTESARKVKRNLLKLTAPQFRNLVDCPLSREAYEDILREQGLA